MNFENLLLFSSIALVATLTPGPAVLLVTSHAIRYGTRLSVLTILGNISGLFILSLLAVLGLSAVILHSAPAFLAVKIIGVSYLVYLGFKLWRGGMQFSGTISEPGVPREPSPGRVRLYLQGVMIALSNPKAIAFSTALFPQFIDSTQPLTTQFLSLVVITMLLSFVCLLGYALLAEKSSARARSNQRAGKLAGRAFGSVFIGSGLALALASQK